MFVERSTQYTSFSPRKQPANAGTECKQFTENASVALQQPILTHAYTKCPPVALSKVWTTRASVVALYNAGSNNYILLTNIPRWLSASGSLRVANNTSISLKYKHSQIIFTCVKTSTLLADKTEAKKAVETPIRTFPAMLSLCHTSITRGTLTGEAGIAQFC